MLHFTTCNSYNINVQNAAFMSSTNHVFVLIFYRTLVLIVVYGKKRTICSALHSYLTLEQGFLRDFVRVIGSLDSRIKVIRRIFGVEMEN